MSMQYPKVGLMIETGKNYGDFRGLMIRGHCHIIEDSALVAGIIQELQAKQSGKTETPREAVASAPKRVILKITPEKVASWDHTKLGGKY